MKQEVEAIRVNHIRLKDTEVISNDKITIKDWEEFGLRLIGAEKYLQWYLGWWWNFGHEKWSRNAEQFIEKIGYKRETLMVYGSVYKSVKPLIRIKGLSFLHHRVVAPLPEDKQIEYLGRALDEKLSVAKLKKIIRKVENPPVDIPEGKYRVIYADPPWYYAGEQHGRASSQDTVLETHYTPMDLEDICAMPVSNYAQDESVLFLWATSPKIFEAEKVIDAWGFIYKAMFIWDKVKHNVGGYNSVRHEILLIATRGSCMPDSDKLIDSVQTIERSDEHSEKPERFREIIEEMYPEGTKLELFARKKIEGWTYHGKQLLEKK